MAVRKRRGGKLHHHKVEREIVDEVAEQTQPVTRITAAAALAAVDATHPVRLRREPPMIAVHLCGTQKVAPPEGFSGADTRVPLAHF